MDIVGAYGYQGPQAGDAHVADLLKRTVDNQWKAKEALRAIVATHPIVGSAVLQAPLPLMATLFIQRLALLRWQMATAWLDGAVVTHKDAPEFSQDLYGPGDVLCDHARRQTAEAIEAGTRFASGTKVRLAGLDTLDDLVFNERSLQAVWNAFEVVAVTAQRELELWQLDQIPERFKNLLQRELQKGKNAVDRFTYLSSEWRTSRLNENRVQLIREASQLVKDLYTLVQGLWAPYTFGPSFSEALKAAPTLAELGVNNPWALTDPLLRKTKQSDTSSEKELAEFWNNVRDPQAVVALAAKVDDLSHQHFIRRRPGRGYGNIAPWPSQFMVRYAFTIGSDTFQVGELVAYYASKGASGKYDVSLRKVGKLTRAVDLLGAAR